MTRFKPKNILLTGATGFIGRRLVRRLIERGDIVRILTRDRSRAPDVPASVTVLIGDLARPGSVLERLVEGADVLFHLAGETKDVAAMRNVHIEGTHALSAAAAGSVKHWVQLSSVGVYGPIREGVVDETHVLAPRGVYETSKAESDRVILGKASRKCFTATVLRPSIVFGPGMPNRSLYQLISAVHHGLFCFIGPPGASANYIHVDNVVEALILCSANVPARGRVYNISDFRSLEEFIGVIASALGKSTPHRRMPRLIASAMAMTLGNLPRFPLTKSRVGALTSRVRYATAQIEQDLGYVPTVSIEEGLRLLVADWKGSSK